MPRHRLPLSRWQWALLSLLHRLIHYSKGPFKRGPNEQSLSKADYTVQCSMPNTLRTQATTINSTRLYKTVYQNMHLTFTLLMFTFSFKALVDALEVLAVDDSTKCFFMYYQHCHKRIIHQMFSMHITYRNGLIMSTNYLNLRQKM